MNDLFDTYYQDFRALAEDLRARDASADLYDEADEIISQMELELRSARSRENEARLEECRATLAQIRADKSSLLSLDMSSESTITPYNSHAADRLLDGQRRLEESHRTLLETENVGSSLLTDLRTQRDRLEHTRNTLHDSEGLIDRANSRVKEMYARLHQQKLTTYAIIALLVFIILYLVFFKLL